MMWSRLIRFLLIRLGSQPNPHASQSVRISGIRQQGQRPPPTPLQPEIQDDDKGMRITVGQPGPTHDASAGFQAPAFIQQDNLGDKSISARIAIAIGELDQRESDSSNESRFDPPRNTGNNNGDAGQEMANAAANQQKPRRTQLKFNFNQRLPPRLAKEAHA